MNEKPKRKLRWRLLRWGLIGLAVLITLAALLITEENWRGKHAWENYKREATARGERFDLASAVPPAVPDEQNFFCAPIVAEALEQIRRDGSDHSRQSSYRMNFNIYRGESELWPNHGGNWQKAELSNLKGWPKYFQAFNASPEGKTNGFPVAVQPQTPAADILLALNVFHPALEELRQASQRPYARIPLNYENDFDAASELLPWLANMKRCAQFLDLRILAEQQAGQGEQALQDTLLLLRVNDCIREQPFLISHLVRIAITAITLQTAYEGLAQRCWSDAQLAELEQTLAKADFFADYQFCMKGEKIFAIRTFEKQRLTREIKSVDDELPGTNKIITTSLRLMPEAYFYQNQLCFAKLNDRICATLVDVTNRVISPAVLKQFSAEISEQAKHYSPYSVQALAVAPAIAAAVPKFARIQVQLDLARVACALERFHLANGNYPETLDPLAPKFIEKLPHDLINGQPLHYRRTDDPPSLDSGAVSGKFVLYSVGWDEKDDGGKIFLAKNGAMDQKKGDWVWQYPQK